MFIVSASSPGSRETHGLSIFAKKASLKKATLLLALTVFMIIYVPHPVSAQALSPFSCGGEPDFSIAASPSEFNIAAGSSNSTTLTLKSFYGFTGTINITALASSPYLNASLTLDSVVLPSGGSKTSALDISANSTTPGGSYSVSVTASNGTLTHYVSVDILVPGPDFRLTSATLFTTVARGSTATDVISVTSLNGFSGTVTLDSSSSPHPVAITLTPASISLAAGETKNSTLDFRTNSTTVPGYYDVSVKGTSGSLSRSTAVFILVIGPSFELSATPDSLTLSRGSSGHVAINVTSLHDFSSPVSLSAFADPGIGLSFSLPVVTPPANGGLASDLTVSAMPLAYVGLHTVEVLGMSGPQANFTFVSVKVTGVAADFNMTAAPDSVTIMPGGASASSTITFTSIDGFADTLAVSLFCPFIGLKASISPGNVTLTAGGTASDALTVSADPNANAGDYFIDVEGNNGTLFHSTFVSVKVATPDFDISASPPYLSIALPGSGTSTITVASILGYSATVTLAVTSHSSGLTVNCPTTSVSVSSTVNGTSVCTFSATIPGSYTAEITGTASALSHSLVVYVIVTGPQPDFDISASPTNKGPLYPGAHGTGTVTITPLNGFTGTVDLTATGSSGLTATLSPTSVTGGLGTSTLDVTAPAAGTYTVTVTGTSSSLVHTTAVITVNVVDFNITASSPGPAAVGVYAASTILVVPVNGFPGTVTLTGPPPAGLTCYPFSPTTLTGSGTATLSCSSTTPGTYPVTITGTSGSLTHSTMATFTFVLVPDFAVTASTPSSVNVGQSASSTITLTALNGFTGTVTLADPPPAGLTCGAIAPGSLILPPSPATATLSCSATAAGSYTVTVTGTGSSGSHTATATFNFKDFTINASPASIGPVIIGASGTSTITVTAQNGFSGAVSLSANPSAGLTATLGTPNVTGFGTSTLTVSATAAGTYTVTVTGTSDTLSHATNTVTVTVTTAPPPDFSITAASPSSVNTGQTASSTITVTALNSFTGTVSLYDSPLPTGLTCDPIMSSSLTLPPSPATANLFCSATAAGSYTVTIKGTGRLGFHLATTTFTFMTPPPPDFSISASKSPLSIQAGDTTAETVTLTSLSGFTGTVSISATVSPSGPQASLVPTSITLGVPRNSTLTIAVPATVSVGTYTVTVTGTYGSLSHTATVTVSVTAASPAPPQQAASNILGLDPTVFYGVIGVVIAAVAGGIGVLMWKKRSSPASTAK